MNRQDYADNLSNEDTPTIDEVYIIRDNSDAEKFEIIGTLEYLMKYLKERNFQNHASILTKALSLPLSIKNAEDYTIAKNGTDYNFSTLGAELRKKSIPIGNQKRKVISFKKWRVEYLPVTNTITNKIETPASELNIGTSFNGIIQNKKNQVWSLYEEPISKMKYIVSGIKKNAISFFVTLKPSDENIIVRYN